MQGILERVGMIHDPRNASYIKHKLSDILFTVMRGVLSGLQKFTLAIDENFFATPEPFSDILDFL